MKEKSLDIALDVQSRTVFCQRARGADLYIIPDWRNQRSSITLNKLVLSASVIGLA